jgi:TonB family protein
MGKAALPSLAVSVLLHLALPLGIGRQVLSASRAPLLPSKPTELELVPMDPTPTSEASLAALVTGSTKLQLVAERALPPRRSAAPSPPVLPAPPLPTPVSAVPMSESRAAASPSAESELTRESTESAVVATPTSVVEPRVAASSRVVAPSVVEPGSTPPSSGMAAGAAPAASGAAARGASGPATGASSSWGAAVGGGDTARALRAAYLQELRRRVLGHRVYPYLARRARLEGTVCLRVSLNGQGEVAGLQATCRAPEALLEAAFAAVRTAAPFGPLPTPLRELTLDLPVVFQLEAL